ncbi:histidine kinase dimerization/phosphoacceptor domain -containing protein [Ekhidna sp.]|uniref:histidine kinase dimerization/phosphoacceptor domain -containing protein n=1 Tax=Ekhidna sp. TaxID=2608089 RepID=UPI00329998A7
MRSIWLPYDESLDEYSQKEVTNLMRTFLFIIPGIAVILASLDFIFGYTSIALTTLSVPFFCWASMYFLNRGQINSAMIIITTLMIIATSIICFLGAGIHEVGIIIFPVIVFFSSLVMNVKGVIITSFIVVICLILIVIEEQLNIFPSYAPITKWVDLTVALSVLIIHTFMTFSFSSITKNNLLRIRDELENQKKYKSEIAENLEEKTELLRLVHHRVKNNLLLINSLIELETYGKPDVKEEMSEIADSIHTIARAHDPLYHTDDYKQVSIKPYLEKLIATFAQSRTIKALNVEFEDCLIFHEKALLLGIVLQKLLSSIMSLETMDLGIVLKSKGLNHELELFANNQKTMALEDSSLAELLTQQIGGKLMITKNKIGISFPAES